jgi:hypothetical protein
MMGCPWNPLHLLLNNVLDQMQHRTTRASGNLVGLSKAGFEKHDDDLVVVTVTGLA